MNVVNLFKGLTFCVLWYSSILFGFLFIYCPLLPVLFYSNHAFRILTDKVFAFWELYPTALLEMLFGTKIIVHGDFIDPDELSVLVMNHRTRVDWNYLWLCMYHATKRSKNYRPPKVEATNGKVNHQNGGIHLPNGYCDKPRGFVDFFRVFNQQSKLKYVLKDEIRHVPGPGWVMQMNCFMYIKRNWQHDEAEMSRVAKYLEDINYTYQLLIFPEGTDLSETNMRKSDSFARKNNLLPYKQVLHPRTRGFISLVQSLRPKLGSVYDITVAYSSFNKWNVDTSVASCCLKDMICGKFPAEVHFSIKRFPENILPEDEDSLAAWLNERWDAKEKHLDDFYHTGRFVEVGRNLNNFDKYDLIVAFVFWSTLVIVVPLLICFLEIIRWYVISCCVSFVLLNILTGGFHHLEMGLYDYKYSKRT